MNETPEPLAAVLAEMRDFARPLRVGGDLCSNVALPATIGIWADRIEAAAERKRASLEDALSHCREYAKKIERENEEGETRLDAEEIIATVDNEFAGIRPLPARNCDRFATAEEAVAAFADHLRAWENAHGICSEYPNHAVKVPAGAFAWLFAPAEVGDHA